MKFISGMFIFFFLMIATVNAWDIYMASTDPSQMPACGAGYCSHADLCKKVNGGYASCGWIVYNGNEVYKKGYCDAFCLTGCDWWWYEDCYAGAVSGDETHFYYCNIPESYNGKPCLTFDANGDVVTNGIWDYDEGGCIVCGAGGVQTSIDYACGVKSTSNTCEELCGADPACDEVSPDTIIGYDDDHHAIKCNANCEVEVITSCSGDEDCEPGYNCCVNTGECVPASEYCEPGDLNGCNFSPTYFRDKCTSNCRYEEWSKDDVCWSDPSQGCTADSDCHGKKVGEFCGYVNGVAAYCDSNCQCIPKEKCENDSDCEYPLKCDPDGKCANPIDCSFTGWIPDVEEDYPFKPTSTAGFFSQKQYRDCFNTAPFECKCDVKADSYIQFLEVYNGWTGSFQTPRFMRFALSPNPAEVGRDINAKILLNLDLTEIANNFGEHIKIIERGGRVRANCPIDVLSFDRVVECSFDAPTTKGERTYYAKFDWNGDGDTLDEAESVTTKISISCAIGGEPCSWQEPCCSGYQCIDGKCQSTITTISTIPPGGARGGKLGPWFWTGEPGMFIEIVKKILGGGK